MEELKLGKTALNFFVFLLAAAWVVLPRWRQYRLRIAKLKEIPTLGHSSYLPSYISAILNLRKLRSIIGEGYEKARKAFKIPLPDKWLVLISGSDMLEDLRKATDEQLSLRDAFEEFLHTEIFFGRQTRIDPYHVTIYKNTLTRSIGSKFSDMHQEMVLAFEETLPMTHDWIKVPVLKKVLPIVCRTSNRVFVGTPLCRDKDWLALNVEYTTKVFTAAVTLNILPKSLQPLVGWLINPLPACHRRAEKHLRPVILERLETEDKTYSDCPDDLLTWLIRGAQGIADRLDPVNIVRRVLNANFAAVHTTSNAFSNALIHLAVYPEYIEPLRNEVNQIIQQDGWTKVAMGKMRKLDSFLKESHRVSGSAPFGVFRKTRKDFVFSNGVVIPAGTFMATTPFASAFDEKNYQNPSEFDGFRFDRLREREGESLKHQMVTPELSFVNFGLGTHACPGRFFAVNELKALVSHTLLNYDIKLDESDNKPKRNDFGRGVLANRGVEILFRKRSDFGTVV
ncbi:cytochrome P450 [Marasmius fiardii PR-910]|nr:cytochrome P450 [Marasmius fiardii PR-910]